MSSVYRFTLLLAALLPGVLASVGAAPPPASQPLDLPIVVGWRGDGSGVFSDATPPVEWSAASGKNITWHTRVGSSYSSPIVVGNKVFVTSEPDRLLCVARESGEILWEAANGFDDLPAEANAVDPKLQSSCGYSTPTPVSDGKRVYAVFGTGIVACYDVEGARNWITYMALRESC